MSTEPSPSECGVCFNSVSSSSNQLINCIGCNINVHIKCYILQLTDTATDWYCDVCIFKQRKHTQFPHTLNLKCNLCPNTRNTVLKQQTNGEWSHIFCSFWHKNLCKSHTHTIDNPKLCNICTVNHGITHKCFHPNCHTYFHPLCGKHSQYSQIICKMPSPQTQPIFIQLCLKHKHTNITQLLHKHFKHKTVHSNIGPIALINESGLSHMPSLVYADATDTTDTNNTSMSDSEDAHMTNEYSQLSLDQKLLRNDIALNKKEVIQLLWDRTDKYHSSVTANDYLRIAPHNYYYDPLFADPIKGKENPINIEKNKNKNTKRKRTKNTKIKINPNSMQFSENEKNSFQFRFDTSGIQSQFHDCHGTNDSENNEWTLEGIKQKLIDEINGNNDTCVNESDIKSDNKCLNYFTNASVNRLVSPVNDCEISVIPFQLGLSMHNAPNVSFENNNNGTDSDSDSDKWDGNTDTYKVSMDEYGWKWVLKRTDIPTNTSLLCPCLLCKHISREYRQRRATVQRLALSKTLNIKNPNIIHNSPAHKQSIAVSMETKYGKALTEFKKMDTDTNDNSIDIEYETVMNDESEKMNKLQPRKVNIIEKIALQRWRNNGYKIQTNVNIDAIPIIDEPSSVYYLNKDTNTNTNSKPKRGRKRKRINRESNAFKKRIKLNSFRSLDRNVNICNDISAEIYSEMMKLYALQRVNDDTKHMIRTNLRERVSLNESVLFNKLHNQVIDYGLKHICIWQRIRLHFVRGFSDKCGIFDTHSNINSSNSNRRNSYIAHTHCVNEESDVSVCCVCFDGTFTDKNLIIFCDYCNIGVHRYCYGLKAIPNESNEWLCESCEYLQNNIRGPNLETPQCCLCPIKGGALQRTKEGGFAHITCAVWIRGIEIGNIRNMSPILNVTNVIAEQKQTLLNQKNFTFDTEMTDVSLRNKNKNLIQTRSKRAKRKNKEKDSDGILGIELNDYLQNLSVNKCVICGESQGCFIQCSFENCQCLFHVLCAWFNGQFMEMCIVENENGNLESHAFCVTHTPLKYGGQFRNFEKFKRLRTQGLTENVITAQIHRKERILHSLMADTHSKSTNDTYLTLKCAVCFEDKNGNNSQMISCHNCGICVHCKCYQINEENIINNNIWFCEPCNSDNGSIQCLVCPRKGGALKLFNNKYWMHLCCVLYINNGSLSDVNTTQLIKTMKKQNNKCYLCHLCEGYTLKCDKSECNVHFHALCNIFSDSMNRNSKFCRKHAPILAMNGGVHNIDSYMKLLKLDQIYSEIQIILYALQQRQFRNKALLSKMEKEIRKKLQIGQTPSTPSEQLIIDENSQNNSEILSMNESDTYEKCVSFEEKYKYKMTMINAMKCTNMSNTEIEKKDSENSSNDSGMVSMNALLNYTNSGIEAVREIYNKFENIPNQSTFKNMHSIINKNGFFENNFKQFNDGMTVNKLISFAKYINKVKSEIFNGLSADENNQSEGINLDFGNDKNVQNKLNEIDETYFNEIMNEFETEFENKTNNMSESESSDESDSEIDSILANKIRKCKMCGRERGKWSITVWRNHLNNKHSYKCTHNHCNFRTTMTTYLKTHLSEHN